MNAKLSVEQAATQLVNYLMPKGLWIGAHWIDTFILERLTSNLDNALRERKNEKHNK